MPGPCDREDALLLNAIPVRVSARQGLFGIPGRALIQAVFWGLLRAVLRYPEGCGPAVLGVHGWEVVKALQADRAMAGCCAASRLRCQLEMNPVPSGLNSRPPQK